MYSDASKFPYSGGYVWISDCCPQKFVSVRIICIILNTFLLSYMHTLLLVLANFQNSYKGVNPVICV